ncbi:MAG: heavy metal sensor histidine kinase [Pseudomonadota bacterium]
MHRARYSIAARLSLMLIAVFYLVLAGIGTHFYAILDNEFTAQTRAELGERAAFTLRALAGLRSARDLAVYGEEFEALVVGHHRVLLAVLDGEGQVLHRSAKFAESDPMLFERIRERAVAGLEGEFEHRGEEDFLGRTMKTRIGGADVPVWVAIAHDLRDRRAILPSHGQAMLISLSIGAVVAALGALWIVRAGLAPLAQIAAAAERISGSRLDQRIRIGEAPPELGRLADAFNAMLDRLADSFRRLSDFSSDLAHELRTPINSLLGHAQVALSRPRSAEEYRSAIESIVEDGERLARIVRDLLFLARADNAMEALRKERFDLRAEVDRVAAYFGILADERDIRLATEGQAEVTADRAMIQRAIGNLLSNALRHTPRGGTIQAKIRSGGGGEVFLEVSNPGPGIAAEHLPRIFDRFYLVERARGDPESGTGLGLAIVKSIAELHGGSVEASSTPGGLTTIRLKLGSSMSERETRHA